MKTPLYYLQNIKTQKEDGCFHVSKKQLKKKEYQIQSDHDSTSPCSPGN